MRLATSISKSDSLNTLLEEVRFLIVDHEIHDIPGLFRYISIEVTAQLYLLH